MSANRVLVTGSGGFIGGAIARRLQAAGVEVLEAGRPSGIELSDWASVSGLPECDSVIHAAGRTYVPDSLVNPLPFYRDNVTTTLHLLELARRRHAVFVLASSYVYGTPRYLPIDESHPVNASNPYMSSKLLAEQLCEAYHRDFGLPVVILRLFNVYGSGQRKAFLVPAIADGVRRGVLRLGDRSARRDFVHVDDAADAFIAALGVRGTGFDVFNIGSGASVSVEELVAMMQRLSGRTFEVEYGAQTRTSEITDVVADITSARQVLGWQPRIDLETGLRRVLEEESQVLVNER